MADLTTRVVNILKSPQTEWPVIAAEPADVPSLFKGYVMPLAAIGPVASWLGSSIIGTITPFGTFRGPIVAGFVVMVLSYVLSLVGVFIATVAVEWLAPKFKSVGSRTDALKMVAYSSTAGWVAGALNLIPFLGILAILAMLYGIYLFYLGLPVVMKTPSDQVVPYMVVCAVVILVIMLVIWAIVGAIAAAFILGSAAVAM